MKFNDELKQFYITPDDVQKDVPVTPTDLSATFGDGNAIQQHLKYLSERVYDFLFSHISDFDTEQAQNCIRYSIYLNQSGERLHLRRAISHFAYAAMQNDEDVAEFIGKPMNWKPIVYEKLANSGLLVGKFTCTIPSAAEQWCVL